MIGHFFGLFLRNAEADRVVPPTDFTARLTVLTSAAMAFLTVFALTLSIAAGRIADKWASELARSSTLRITAPAEQLAAQEHAALKVLLSTPGIAKARSLSNEEQRALLEPWFGPGLPIENLPVPRLIEIIEDDIGYDPVGLRARLQAEVPGAFLDDHTRWREPLVDAAKRLRYLSYVSIAFIALAMAAMITLAAQAALSANAQVIRVMRLVGARDDYIAGAFIRRFTIRGFNGALLGAGAGIAAVLFLPATDVAGGFLTGLGFRGNGWFAPAAVPASAAVVAFFATRAAAFRTLKELS